MRKILIRILATIVGIAIIAIASVQIKFNLESSKHYTAPDFTIHDEVLGADVNLGKRLYYVRSGCVDCHGENQAGAQVMDNGPMGTIHGANITPFNLSSWSDEEIARAIRYGIHKTGRTLRFMPAIDFEVLSKGDVAALVAFLRSVPSVEKPSHLNTFGPVAKFLSITGQMPLMFPAKVVDLNKGFGEKPEEAPTAQFGRYLAQSCVGCHGFEYRGGKIPGGDPSWPEASNIRFGANPAWTESAFQEAIRSGVSPISHQPIRMPMPVKLLQQMNETEIKAIWEYLHSLN